ncbi:MAG: O-antigen ligase family protein [Firmicutes bacterium]|nr:O-antigen ligase family protein [Bacillota bacterium]
MTKKKKNAGVGIISGVFTSYDRLEAAWERGAIYSAVSSLFTSPAMRKFRVSVSRSLENSLLVRFFTFIFSSLPKITLRTYGVFIFFSGFYSLIVYAIKNVASTLTSELDALITGVLLILLSFPLLLSKKTLSEAALGSKIGSYIAFDMLGFWREGAGVREGRHERGDIAMLLGLLVGLLSFNYDAAIVLFVLLITVLSGIVFIRPEAGIVMLFAAFPLMSETFAECAVITILLSYIFKLARGRRSLKFDIADTVFAIFALLLLFGAAVNYGSGTDFGGNYALPVFALSYFLVKNLMNDEKERGRMLRAAIFGGSLLAVLTLLYKLLGVGSISLDGISSDVLASRVGLFDSILGATEALAPYMAAMMIIMLAYVSIRGHGFAAALIFLAAAAVAAVLLGSRGIWLGIIFGIFVLFVAAGRRFVLFPAGIMALLCGAALIFDDTAYSAYLFSMLDISELYTVSRTIVRQNTLALISENALGGIGVGDGIFASIYDGYSAAGAYASDSGNLLLEITSMLGISGLIVFIAAMLLFLIKTFTASERCDTANARMLAGAPAAGIVAMIFCGMTSYIWADSMMFLGFVMMLGFSASSSSKSGNDEAAGDPESDISARRDVRLRGYVYGSASDASIDVKL